jgi:SAM-dependent methyltransferase
MRLDDPEVVSAEYASEAGLAARSSVYQGIAGPDARDVVFAAIASTRPTRVLEVGCGQGELAQRLRDEVTADVVAVDLSPRMVELTRSRGVEALVGDVCALPFASGSFDCVTANWMLYHAPDIDLALSELARVLRPGGTLVAATNSVHHLEELWTLVGRDKAGEEERHFFSEDAEQLLARHFASVRRSEVVSPITFDTGAARGYVASSIAHKHLADRVPELDEPLVVTRRCTVLVAQKAGEESP